MIGMKIIKVAIMEIKMTLIFALNIKKEITNAAEAKAMPTG
jgi:hypothetical protein